MHMREKHFTVALALARTMLETREQFIFALRGAAMAQLGPSSNIDMPSRYVIEPHIDDALYAIGRDGPEGLEDNVRSAVEEIVREALEAARRG